MGILVFIIVLVVLILVHELGHFIVAKLSGMRVEEFGLGYPPRAATLGKIGETEYTLNWLPFGGFVKIYGEDGLVGGERGASDHGRSFTSKPRILQALVLVAGVTMNLLLAYVLITGVLMAGVPRVLAPEEARQAEDVSLAVTGVLPGSPAEEAGLAIGDRIVSAEDGHYMLEGKDPASFTEFISSGQGNTTIALTVRHADGEEETVFAAPETGLIADDPSRPALGVEIASVGVLPLSFGEAIVEGVRYTWAATEATAIGLWHFFYGIFTGDADFSQVAGPVGIAGVVGDASASGLVALLSITAIISINLAIINLIPVPALDGGRLLFVAVEAITRRRIKPSVVGAMNAVSFLLLIFLMLAVTAYDIYRIVS